MGDKHGSAISLSFLGFAHLNQGDAAAAYSLLAESLALAQEIGITQDIADVLDGLAGVAWAHGKPAYAVHLFGAAEALRTAIHMPPAPLVRLFVLDRYLAPARRQLDAAVFDAAWQAGQAMTLDQAIAYALSLDSAT
jgi:non-specific serine/threonine protein kinase